MNNRKVKSITALAETKFLNLYDAEYVNKKGKIKHWLIASRKDFRTYEAQLLGDGLEKSDAVVIAALHKESGKIILVRQFRVPLNDYVYELPAGLIDGAESMETAVRRELKEETGLDLVEINYKKTKGGLYSTAGMSDESMIIAFCSCEGRVSQEYLEEDEDIETIMLSKEEARELIRGNFKFDVKAYMILQFFAELGEQFLTT